MTEEAKKRELARLETKWAEERKKVRKYRFLMEGAQERMREIEQQIKNL